MTVETESSRDTASGTGRGVLTVDCDVHPHLPHGLDSLAPYLSQAWRRRMFGGVAAAWAGEVYASRMTIPKNDLYINPVGSMRRDAYPEDGSVPGSDPTLVKKQLLDGCDVDRAILLGGNVFGLGAMPDAAAAAVIATAFNEWIADVWLDHEERFRAAAVVTPQDPTAAAAEIERLADDHRFVGVLLPLMNILMGNSHYYPIYEAAARHGMPVMLHPNSVDGIYQQAPAMAGGVPTYYVEWHTGLTQIFQANVSSLVCHGVFERFPELHIVVAEGGVAWLPDLMWRLDKDWDSLRDEVPWVKRPPSEYLLDHVRFTTQPLIEPRRREHLLAMLDMVDAGRTLLFSSDYPHWDFDDPARALAIFPEAIRDQVRGRNAMTVFGERLR